MVNNRQRMAAANRTNNAPRRRQRTPRITTTSGGVTVTGSENLFNVSIGAAGAINSINVNPRNIGATTWLARQASLYNKFKYTRLRLRFVPFVPTITPGRVVIAWNGDIADTAPTTTQQVTQYENSVETPVWMETGCNMGISRKPEYTVAGTSTTESTPGSFFVATDNGDGEAEPAGSLYIDYTIQFWSRAAFADNA